MKALVILGEGRHLTDIHITYPRSEDLSPLYAAWAGEPVSWETITPELHESSRWADIVAIEGLPTMFKVEPSRASYLGAHVLALETGFHAIPDDVV